jgi:hypothetical protein
MQQIVRRRGIYAAGKELSRQADKQKGKAGNRQTDRQIGSQETGRQPGDRQADRQPGDRQADC